MWPWEHLAVGYLLYSTLSRARGHGPPSDGAALAVVVATQFPDLVDKPLAWSFDVVESGVSVAHSIFVAVGLSILALLVARRFDRQDVGVAFAVGYLSHLPADAVYPALLGGDFTTGAFFWPLVIAESGGRSGFVENFSYYLLEFLEFLTTPLGLAFLLLEVLLLSIAAAIWFADGYPGLPLPSRVRRWV